MFQEFYFRQGVTFVEHLFVLSCNVTLAEAAFQKEWPM